MPTCVSGRAGRRSRSSLRMPPIDNRDVRPSRMARLRRRGLTTDPSAGARQTGARQAEARQTEAGQTGARQTEARQTEAGQTVARQTEARHVDQRSPGERETANGTAAAGGILPPGTSPRGGEHETGLEEGGTGSARPAFGRHLPPRVHGMNVGQEPGGRAAHGGRAGARWIGRRAAGGGGWRRLIGGSSRPGLARCRAGVRVGLVARARRRQRRAVAPELGLPVGRRWNRACPPALHHHEAAVDRKDLAGDERGLVRAEEGDGVGDLVGRAEAAERGLREQLLLQ